MQRRSVGQGIKKGSSVSGGARTDSAAEQAKEAGVGHAQDQKQGDERKQHPDDDVHLMDGEGKMIVELFLGIDKVLVAVVKQGLFALFKVSPLIGKLGLLLCQLCFAGSQNGFAPGKLLPRARQG